MTRRIIALAGVLALAAPSPAVACLWDHDTLHQERARFPHALELIAGKFLRHSKEAYAWRIRDRTARLAADPDNLALRDDLAVAYQKVGDTAKAIEIMTAADRLRPDRYETLANLGTFYILAGELERGLAYVDRALAINPEAHFGRERYQKWLVEYALSKRVDGALRLPLRSVAGHESAERSGFAAAVLRELPNDSSSEPAALAKAVTGVLGMMRFANHDNPLLLEALGDLLAERYGTADAKQLGVRAYLQASYVVTDPSAKAGYRALAADALHMQIAGGELGDQMSLDVVETELRSELAEGVVRPAPRPRARLDRGRRERRRRVRPAVHRGARDRSDAQSGGAGGPELAARPRRARRGEHREPRIPAPAQERLIRPPPVVFRWRLPHDRTSYMCARR